ncbi:disease resistance-like protein CSA1 [Cornus florida]|uniref:disease resistance-like protein CSA1 n=1 Tax=Cornus florida TaxID=4283 RepID=UPI002898625D|nr:disease resistance-like protein CSA1 [Cornus florida]
MKVHESIGELKRLVLLNVKDCKNLRNLPTKIGQLKLLKNFILTGCSKLVELPKEMREMESLKYFNATAINQLPSTSNGIISRLFRLRKPSESILDCLPCSLVSLNLANCNLRNLPRDLGRLSVLEDLALSGNPICSLPESIKCLTMLQFLNLRECTKLQLLPESIKCLTMLQSLHLRECTKLQLLPELPMSLKMLDINRCRSLEIITNLPNGCKLDLYAYDCETVVEVKKLFRLEPIRNIDTEMIKNLELIELESMEEVEVNLLNKLTNYHMICPIQGLYEFGIFSIYLSGNEVPAWYSSKTTTSSICFNVPSLPNNLKIRGLNVCVAYNFHGFTGFLYEYIMRTFNKTKDVKWTYYPTVTGFPNEGENMIWVSHWKLGNQFEAGDEVAVDVEFFDDLCYEYGVKELGVHIVYEQEEGEKDTQHNTYTSFPDDVFDGADSPSRGYHFIISKFCTYMSSKEVEEDDDA